MGKPVKRLHNQIKVISPFDHQRVGDVYAATLNEVREAVGKAQQKFLEFTRIQTPFSRYQLLNSWANLIEEKYEKLAKLISQESGKVIRDSRIEVARSVQIIKLAAEAARNVRGEFTSCDITQRYSGASAIVSRIPLGVVAAITPFNFPLSSVAHKVAPALACGNTVVLKPAPETPLTAVYITELLTQSHAEEGLLNLVHGDSEVGEALVTNPTVKYVSFTGSAQVGKRIAAIAGMKRLTLELSGNDALMVFDDADIDKAAKVAVAQRFGNSGQRCNAVKRLFVHEKVADELIDSVVALTRKLKGGDPLNELSDYGPLINIESAKEIELKVTSAIKAGAKLLIGGKRDGNFYTPTILTNVPKDHPILQSETFGPVLPIETFNDLDGLINRVNSTPYGLQAGAFTQRLDIIKKLFQEIEVGTLNINEGPAFRVDTLPFGGVKESGLGREGIDAAMREMSEMKVLTF